MAVSKTTPAIKDFAIQTKTWKRAKDREFFGVFLDPGMGKCRVAFKEAQTLHREGKIDAMVVLAKNSGKTAWVIWDHMIDDPIEDTDQCTVHLPDYPVIKGLWISSATGQNKKCWQDFEKRINGDTRGKLIVLAINFQALLSGEVQDFLAGFMQTFRTYLVADESTQIGEYSKRTRASIKLGKFAKFRRLLCGTPVLKDPMKIFWQAKFADGGTGKALGYTSFYPFRNRYAIMGGFEGRQIIGYQNQDELADKLDRWSIRALAEDWLDMPERSWSKRRVEMTKEQMKAYKSMREEFFAEVGDTTVTATIVLAQMTRLQQILGGYLPNDQGNPVEIIPPASNPKFKEALDIIENAPGQCVVWFRFRAELDGFAQLLTTKKISFYEFHGGVDETERVRRRKSFKRGERTVMLSTGAGGDSIDEFKVANTVIFLSNDADTEGRVQRERRTWRSGSAGLHKMINYYDIIVPNSVDIRFMQIMRQDSKVSSKLLREKWREWI